MRVYTGTELLDATDLTAELAAAESARTTARLLVATDGSPASDSALIAAHALAERDGADVELLSVVEPPDMRAPYASLSPASETVIAAASDDRFRLIETQRLHTGVRDEWPLVVAIGDPASIIARRADAHRRDLILLGLSEHGIMDRVCQRETALRVARTSRVPVLAVAARSAPLPRRIAVAVDLHAPSLHTARVAASLLGHEGTLYLVHVAPRVAVPMADSRDWEAHYGNEIRGRFDALVRDLVAPPSIRIECVTLNGDPTRELLSFTRRAAIDVLACGSHARNGFVDVLGRVPATLFRSVHCSMLMVPPAVA